MSDLFNLVATTCIFEMAIVLAMLETDRVTKTEPARIVWSRRAFFGAGAATLLYAGLTHDWEMSCLLMTAACVAIFTVNIVSIRRRNHPPLQGHRFIANAEAAKFWRRYP